MIGDGFNTIGQWWWVIGGLTLLGLEILMPATYFLWFGVSAIIVGALSIVVDLSWQVQVIIFVVLAVVLVIVGRRFFANRRAGESDAPINRRSEGFLGQTFVLMEPIVNGVGRIRAGDTTWRVMGPDTGSGRQVQVVAVDGPLLTVEVLPEA
jgi:membrane protein implicated in regulation of membrane protease activity